MTPARRSAAAGAPGAAAGQGTRKARGDRRKRQTRERLLRAALTLMAERGRDGVTINEITEAADVGFGTFFNHFPSKEAIHDAVVADVFDTFGEALSHLADVLDDPAEVLAASIRIVARQAQAQPVWGRFLLRNAFSPETLSRGMGRYLLRDLQRGIAAGRFVSHDALITLLTVGGAALGAVTAALELGTSRAAGRRTARQLGFDVEGIPERAVTEILRTLGLPATEAAAIARRPLPPIAVPAGLR